MQYKIIDGSLPYDPSITEEIFKQLITAAETQGSRFHKHYSDGGNTYNHFKRNGYLNFSIVGKTYHSGKVYVTDNNSQNLPRITLKDLQQPESINNTYELY